MAYMSYSTVTDLVYSTADKSGFLCNVTFDAIGTIPFGATSSDVEEHGREIYTRGIAGDFGPIAPYVEPEVPVVEVKSVKATFGGKSLTVTEDVSNQLIDLCYDAVALGDTKVAITVDSVVYSGTLTEARNAVKAFRAL